MTNLFFGRARKNKIQVAENVFLITVSLKKGLTRAVAQGPNVKGLPVFLFIFLFLLLMNVCFENIVLFI